MEPEPREPKEAPDPSPPEDPAHLPSINEPAGSEILPEDGIPPPGEELGPSEPPPTEEPPSEEPPPEAASLDDPDEMEAELEEAEDEDEIVVHRTKTTVHRGTPSKTLPKHRKK